MNDLEFTMRDGLIHMNLLAGIMGIVAGSLSLYSGGSGVMLPVGIIITIFALSSFGKVIVSLRDDHLYIKAAPLAAAHHLPYRNIASVERESEKKACAWLRDGSRVKLPLAAIDESGRDELVDQLSQRVTDHGSRRRHATS